jgi:type III secretory pathway component EscU
MDTLLINVGKLHKELEAAGLPVISVHSDGMVDYSRLLSNAEKAKVDQLMASHDPVDLPVVTTDQIARALWKKVMLGDPKEADAIRQILE